MMIGTVRQPIDSQGTKPYIVEGRTLVPIRAVIEAFSGTVAWDAAARKVTVSLGDNSLDLWIGRSLAALNGSSLSIDPANPGVFPVISGGRTMLPLRFVSECLGIDVQYEAVTRMITLTYTVDTTPPPPLPPPAPTLVSPANGSTQAGGPVTLSWLPPAGADSYRIQVLSGSSVVHSQSSLTSPAYAVPDGTLSEGTYTWQASAHNDGGWGVWSSSFTFSISKAVVPLPDITLKPGDSYFSVDGQTRFIFSRNAGAIFKEDFGNTMDWMAYSGDHVLRIGVENFVLGGYGYTNTGEINEEWAKNWDAFLTLAEAHGLYVVPVFTGWINWNTTGYNIWKDNPFNPANGGPATDSSAIFQEGSPAQKLYLGWARKVATRWQDHKNILAWEVLCEGNLITGVSEQAGIAFTEHMAEVIRAADPNHRPITAALADVGDWPNYYKSGAIDLIQAHPYTGKLDRLIVDEVHSELAAYKKPVLIGESGLDAFSAINPPNAQIGIQHAIWADIVSGAVNGRALWVEDGEALFEPQLKSAYLVKYADVELPEVRFTSGVDFTGFKPLTVQYQSGTKIWGAAIGNESMVLGWFRDAASEPPDWRLLPNIHGQTVTVLVPGSAQNWQVDFYNTKTGYALPGSTLLTRQGDHVIVALPDFTDDIAFKVHVNTSGVIIPPPTPAAEPTPVVPTNTDSIAGQWAGSIYGETTDFGAALYLSFQPGCAVGSTCGKTTTQWCSLDLVLTRIDGDTLVFTEQNASGMTTCPVGGTDYIRLQRDGTLLFRYEPGIAGGSASNGILHRP
jgi:hypothetical protein